MPEGPWIWIDIPQKSLTLYEGTEVKKRYAVATGTGDTPSPIGTFRVTSRFAGDLGGFGTRFFGAETSRGDNLASMAPTSPAGIGSNASHGCIRMYVRDSEELYGLVPNGAKVVIQGGPYGQLDSYLRHRHPWRPQQPRGRRAAPAHGVGLLHGPGRRHLWQGHAGGGHPRTEGSGLPALDAVDEAFYRAIGLILFE